MTEQCSPLPASVDPCRKTMSSISNLTRQAELGVTVEELERVEDGDEA